MSYGIDFCDDYETPPELMVGETLFDSEGIPVGWVTYESDVDKLRALLKGQQVCADDEADARDCPLYDESEPYRCKKERLMQELGIEETS